MLDSINFRIDNINYLDFKQLYKKGIRVDNMTSTNPKTGFTNVCYTFKYNGVTFKFNRSNETILIYANPHKILNKRDITLGDFEKYKQKLNKILIKIFNTSNIKMYLDRIDYCVDIPLTEAEAKMYIRLLKFNKIKYKYMKQKRTYATSIYIKTERGKTNLNIYIREPKTKSEVDSGILRIEVQGKKELLKSEHDKYGIPKELEEYWTKSSMEDYFFKLLRGYLYEGDYQTIERARSIIDNSDYKPNMKHKLKKFVKHVGSYYLSNLMDPKFCKEMKLHYSYGTINNYIKKLNKINVNPIPIQQLQGGTIDKETLPNLLKLARTVAEDKYFK